MDDSTDHKQSIRRRLSVSPSFVIVMTTFIDMIGFGMVIPLLPFHPETVEAGALALGILIGSFSLMQFLFSPILGRLSDKVGRKKSHTFGVSANYGWDVHYSAIS